MRKIKQLLDYAATHPDAAVTYWSSSMVLAAHSDASYLSNTKTRSRTGGHFFMASNISVPENNGAVHTVAQIIKPSCHPRRRRNSALSTSTAAKQYRHDIYLRQCDTIKPQP